MATRFSESLPSDLRFEPTPKRIRAEVEATVVADTTSALLVWEPAQVVPKYAIPEDDVDREQLPSDAARRCDDPDLDGYLLFDWDAFDRWREEDEEVIGHPRDPFHRVDIRRSSRRIAVACDGVALADSRAPVLVFETGLPVRYYLPREDVDMERLRPSPTRTTCAYKGEAHYWSVEVPSGTVEDLAWTYPEPLPDNAQLRDLVAFLNERADIRVDGVLARRPKTQWS